MRDGANGVPYTSSETSTFSSHSAKISKHITFVEDTLVYQIFFYLLGKKSGGLFLQDKGSVTSRPNFLKINLKYHDLLMLHLF